MKYFFILGQNPELSLLELQSFFPDADFNQVDDFCVSLDLEEFNPAEFINNTGGTVKILKTLNTTKEEQKLESIIKELSVAEKPHFAISEIGRDHLPKTTPEAIKEQLAQQGIKSRFVEGSRHGLSAAVLLHQKKVREIYLVQTKDHLYLAETMAVQNIDEWSKRDRQKPYADRKKGMLPPKLARIMVNLARQKSYAHLDEQAKNNSELTANSSKLLYDPFCGTGTVLIEAHLSGLNIIGSDIDTDAVLGTVRNLEWMGIENPQVFVKDVTQVTLQDLKTKVDLIVTEPFLGKPKPTVSFLPKMFKGLEKMYLGTFKNWTRILNSGAVVAIVFPMVETHKKTYSLESLIDKLEKLGYNPILKTVTYSRPNAITQRQILVFRFNK